MRQPSRQVTREILILATVAAIVLTGLVIYSQTIAGYADEAFHLLAARLIRAGRRPYVDFFYQHPPFYAYLTAGWMRVFGDSWRSTHVMSTLLTAGSAMLAGEFVYSRLSAWRLVGAVIAIVAVGFQPWVVEFGTIAQAYGLCMFSVAAAFRLAVAAVDEPTGALSFWSGICAGIAAGSLLLTAPVAPILLAWLAWQEPAGARWKKCVLFPAGVAMPFLPLLWLAWQAPRATVFDVVEFHLFYRSTGRSPQPSFRHDLGTLSEFLAEPTVLLSVLLGALALLFASRGEWGPRRKQELYLCAFLITGLGALATLARPTFEQYFVSLFPLLGMLAAMGACAIGLRIWSPGQAAWLAASVIGIFAWQLLTPLYHLRHGYRTQWQHFEEVARQINRVTPTNGSVYAADLRCYVTARRLPPPGLENHFTADLGLSPEIAASLHIVPRAQIDQRLAAGCFDTICLDESDERIRTLGLSHLYAKRMSINKYYISWERIRQP